MHPKFATAIDSLHNSYEQLVAGFPMQHGYRWPQEKVPGVYLFSEEGQALYVGRTSNLKSRYSGHCSQGSQHYSAAFAFRLAREATGNLKASYKKGEGRAVLAADPIFVEAFQVAKTRIRLMEFRWVEEADSVRQCLLEVYCAVTLETPYNNFDNH